MPVNGNCFNGPFSAGRFFHELSYDNIIRFPRDDARHELILRQTELAEATEKLQKHAGRAEKAREKNEKLQLKIARLLAKAEKPRHQPWWKKLFKR